MNKETGQQVDAADCGIFYFSGVLGDDSTVSFGHHPCRYLLRSDLPNVPQI